MRRRDDEAATDRGRALLREFASVVAPGEVLVIQGDWTPQQAAELQDYAEYWLARNAPEIRAIVLPGDAAQVLPAGALDAVADAAVERALARQRYARGGNGQSGSDEGMGAGGASSSGLPPGVSMVVTADGGPGRASFIPAGAPWLHGGPAGGNISPNEVPRADGCCGGNCGCASGSTAASRTDWAGTGYPAGSGYGGGE